MTYYAYKVISTDLHPKGDYLCVSHPLSEGNNYKGVIMSHLDDNIPTGIHIVEMVNGDCLCPREKQAAILTSALVTMTKHEVMITFLKSLRHTSSVPQEIKLAQDLLDIFDPAEYIPSS